MKRLARLLRRLLVAALALVVIAVLSAYLILRGSLPRLDGEIAVPGLSAVADIDRDEAGIPTLRAATRIDLAFATGYVHGQDRFFAMDLMRRQAAGELSALVGAAAIDTDRYHRLHRFRARAEQAIASMNSGSATLLDAYTRGVNAALDAMSSRPFEYVVLRTTPEPWRPADTLLVVDAMYFDLNDERASRQTSRGLVASVLPSDVMAWLYPDGSAWDAPLVGGPVAPVPIPGPDVFDLRGSKQLLAATYRDAEMLPGSNNWAVSGKLTRSGRAIVANDMHLGLRVPNIFYRARFVVSGDETVDVSGVSLPGTPVMVAGSNGHVAWGFTNSYGNWSDAVVLRPGSRPGTYRTPDGEREFAEHVETIDVKGADPVDFVVRETIWGPVRDDIDYPDGDIAIRWLAHDQRAINLTQLELEHAASVDEALGIANRMGIPPQNFVCGDSDGNIGWTIAGQIPRRGSDNGGLPADWSEGGEWQGWLEPAGYPRIVNPPGGRIWTANARVVDGDALALIGDGGYALGARATQIRDDLNAHEHFVPADMLTVQLDDRAIFLQRWRDLLLGLLNADALDGHQARSNFRRLIADWVPRAAPESIGYRLVRAFHVNVSNRVFDMLVTPARAVYGRKAPLTVSRQFEAPLWALVNDQPAHLITDDYASWRALLLASLDAAIAELGDNGVRSLSGRNWGERNTAAIRHPLSVALPWAARWLDMPRDELPGDRDMPRAQGPSFGASERFAVSPGDEANAYLHMPTGQSGHPLSPYYRRGHEDWVQGNPSPFLPGEMQHRLRLATMP